VAGAKVGVSSSGGGSRGSWQVGFWRYAAEQDLFPGGVAHKEGVSVGSINSLALAMFEPGPDQVKQALEVMEESWAKLAGTKDVWRLRFPPYIAGLWHNSIGITPWLRDLLSDVVDVESIRRSGVELRIHACDLITGQLHTFDQNGPLIPSALASSSFPIAFPLEEIAETEDHPGGLYTDAGVRDIAPAKGPIAAGCDRVVILLSRDPDHVERMEPSELSNVMARTERELDLMLTEIIKGDIAMSRFINQIVRSGKADLLGEPFSRYRDVPIDILYPRTPLGSSLSFERSDMLRQMQQGYDDAKAYFEG
jgi:predicted acylesterase/phospholipase RssA